MTKGAGPAVDVDLAAIEFQVADEFFGDDGERLVDFPQVDIVDSQPCLGQHLAGSRDGRVEHQGRAVADIGGGDDAGPGFQAVLVGIGFGRQQDGRRTVDDAR